MATAPTGANKYIKKLVAYIKPPLSLLTATDIEIQYVHINQPVPEKVGVSLFTNAIYSQACDSWIIYMNAERSIIVVNLLEQPQYRLQALSSAASDYEQQLINYDSRVIVSTDDLRSAFRMYRAIHIFLGTHASIRDNDPVSSFMRLLELKSDCAYIEKVLSEQEKNQRQFVFGNVLFRVLCIIHHTLMACVSLFE